MGCSGDDVRVVSRRMVRPSTTMANGNHPPKEEPGEIHLTPWDLRLLSTDYVQKGILLPKPPAGDAGGPLVDALASTFSRALSRFHLFAGRLVEKRRGDGTVTVSLMCTGEGAEFVHATAPWLSVADITASLFTPPVAWSLYTMNEVFNADAALESLPVLSVQVTELSDGVFIGMSLNHSVGDGTAFWHFFNTWSEIHRRGGGIGEELSTPAPVTWKWFLETSPLPIPMPFRKLEHLVQRFDRPTLQECFFTFSAESVKKLKEKANDEMAGTATTVISSLQALLAHLWGAVCRARRLPPEQGTFYYVIIGCRGRVSGIPPGYIGNAVVRGQAEATAGEVQRKGLGWTAWLLNSAVASFDEEHMKEFLDRWVRAPEFAYMGKVSSSGVALITGSSPRFDVFGNDFGWGSPVAVRSGPAEKIDGNATVYEGPEKGGSISIEVCLAPEVLARLVADKEFMDAVSI